MDYNRRDVYPVVHFTPAESSGAVDIAFAGAGVAEFQVP